MMEGRFAHRLDASQRLAEVLGELFDGSAPTGAAFLGDRHPLVRAIQLRGVLIQLALATLLGLILLIAASVIHLPAAPWTISAAAVVELDLWLAIVFVIQLKRERARDLIIDGHGDVPLPSVAAELTRLLDPRRQRNLAETLEQIVCAAANYDRLPIASRPPIGTRRVREIAPELRELATQLRAGGVGVRGVARVARLLAGGYGSQLWTGQIEDVQSELKRVRLELTFETGGAGP
jgi:hypothetical protein